MAGRILVLWMFSFVFYTGDCVNENRNQIPGRGTCLSFCDCRRQVEHLLNVPEDVCLPQLNDLGTLTSEEFEDERVLGTC